MGHVMAKAVIASPSMQGPGFWYRRIHVGFVMDHVALGQIYL